MKILVIGYSINFSFICINTIDANKNQVAIPSFKRFMFL